MGIGVVMKKKVKTILFVFIVIGVVILNITYKNKNEVTKTKRKRQGNLAIMVKGESGEYISSDAIPKGNYVLNEEKTICENGGKVVSYNNSTGQIGFSFLGSDRCSLYFDKIIDTEKPVISNLKINGKTITAILTDNQSLLAYGFSTSNTLEPTSWTSISGKTYNLSTTIKQDRVYYLWVKDSTGNVIISDVLDARLEGWKTILINNGNGAATVDAAKAYIEGKTTSTTPNFSTVATTNEGMYSAPDDLGTSYYFRGAVDNNWVQFGQENGKDIYWRIIRINGDGSIRMIYTGTTKPSEDTSVTESNGVYITGTGTQITVDNKNTFNFNSSYNKAEYVGYMYTLGEQHGTSTSSTIKTTIDNWYKTTTLETDSTTKALVSQDQIFCNDRSASSTQTGAWTSTGTNYYYGAYGRLNTNKAPILTCPEESDKFTVGTSNGNGTLTYPVGLITADEVSMAGGKWLTNNSSYYLYTNQAYWSGTPDSFSSSTARAIEFSVRSSGLLSIYNVNSSVGVRPVVSLSSKAKLSGSGTYNDVYTVN